MGNAPNTGKRTLDPCENRAFAGHTPLRRKSDVKNGPDAASFADDLTRKLNEEIALKKLARAAQRQAIDIDNPSDPRFHVMAEKAKSDSAMKFRSAQKKIGGSARDIRSAGNPENPKGSNLCLYSSDEDDGDDDGGDRSRYRLRVRKRADGAGRSRSKSRSRSRRSNSQRSESGRERSEFLLGADPDPSPRRYDSQSSSGSPTATPIRSIGKSRSNMGRDAGRDADNIEKDTLVGGSADGKSIHTPFSAAAGVFKQLSAHIHGHSHGRAQGITTIRRSSESQERGVDDATADISLAVSNIAVGKGAALKPSLESVDRRPSSRSIMSRVQTRGDSFNASHFKSSQRSAELVVADIDSSPEKDAHVAYVRQAGDRPELRPPINRDSSQSSQMRNSNDDGANHHESGGHVSRDRDQDRAAAATAAAAAVGGSDHHSKHDNTRPSSSSTVTAGAGAGAGRVPSSTRARTASNHSEENSRSREHSFRSNTGNISHDGYRNDNCHSNSSALPAIQQQQRRSTNKDSGYGSDRSRDRDRTDRSWDRGRGRDAQDDPRRPSRKSSREIIQSELRRVDSRDGSSSNLSRRVSRDADRDADRDVGRDAGRMEDMRRREGGRDGHGPSARRTLSNRSLAYSDSDSSHDGDKRRERKEQHSRRGDRDRYTREDRHDREGDRQRDRVSRSVSRSPLRADADTEFDHRPYRQLSPRKNDDYDRDRDRDLSSRSRRKHSAPVHDSDNDISNDGDGRNHRRRRHHRYDGSDEEYRKRRDASGHVHGRNSSNTNDSDYYDHKGDTRGDYDLSPRRGIDRQSSGSSLMRRTRTNSKEFSIGRDAERYGHTDGDVVGDRETDRPVRSSRASSQSEMRNHRDRDRDPLLEEEVARLKDVRVVAPDASSSSASASASSSMPPTPSKTGRGTGIGTGTGTSDDWRRGGRTAAATDRDKGEEFSTRTHTTVLSTVPSTSSVAVGSPLSMLDGPSQQMNINPNGGISSSSSSWRSSVPVRRAVSHDAMDRQGQGQEIHGRGNGDCDSSQTQTQWNKTMTSSTVRVTGSSGRPASGDPTNLAVPSHVSSQQLRDSHIQQRMGTGTQIPTTSTTGTGSSSSNMRRVAPIAVASDDITAQSGSGSSNDKGERRALGRGLSHMRDMITSAMTHTHQAPSNN